MQANEHGTHALTLNNRSHAEITGVTDVDCFNEQVVVLATTLGTMTISGSGLNITHLNQEEGRLIIDGDFDAVEYASSGKSKEGGFFARLFR